MQPLLIFSVGTAQGYEFKDPFGKRIKYSVLKITFAKEISTLELEDLPEVFNDLDVDLSADPDKAAIYLADQRNYRKIKETAQKLTINFMSPLREGKKLLVLDLDYSKNYGK